MIDDKLQIILITYNRQEHLRKTFEQILCDTSPIKNFDILILDNNSNDKTKDVADDFARNHPKIKYQKNKYNLGISGNIAKAMEMADKEYFWIICDDDKYDFSNWSEVETAVNNGEDAICVARYAIENQHKNDVAYQLLQMTFVPAIILKTAVLNDTVIRNSFDNIYTLFPHICPIVQLINQNKSIYTINKAIVDNGMDILSTDCSYTRGLKVDDLYQRTKTMTWIVGYANICSAIKDTNLKHRAMNVGISYKDTCGGFKALCRSINSIYLDQKNWMHIVDLYLQLDDEGRKGIAKFIPFRMNRKITKAERKERSWKQKLSKSFKRIKKRIKGNNE